MKTKTLSIEKGESCNIRQFPNFHKSGSIIGMKKFYYGKDSLLVRCGNYIYHVNENIYNNWAQ